MSTAPKEHSIASINDMLSLSPDEFKRFLPDLAAWYFITREAVALGAEPLGMRWVDDGISGELHSCNIRIKGTDEVLNIKGSAYREPQS